MSDVGTVNTTSSASSGIFTTVSPFCLLVYVNSAGAFDLTTNVTSTPSLILLAGVVPSFSKNFTLDLNVPTVSNVGSFSHFAIKSLGKSFFTPSSL